MTFFLVTMTHPDGDGWGRHVGPHVAYLQGLIAAGKIRASGPVQGLGKRAGFIIMTVADRQEAQALIDADPFATEGLIDDLTILEWNPMFGAFAGEASPARGSSRKSVFTFPDQPTPTKFDVENGHLVWGRQRRPLDFQGPRDGNPLFWDPARGYEVEFIPDGNGVFATVIVSDGDDSQTGRRD